MSDVGTRYGRRHSTPCMEHPPRTLGAGCSTYYGEESFLSPRVRLLEMPATSSRTSLEIRLGLLGTTKDAKAAAWNCCVVKWRLASSLMELMKSNIACVETLDSSGLFGTPLHVVDVPSKLSTLIFGGLYNCRVVDGVVADPP